MSENYSLNLKTQKSIDSVEEYKFEPIKGYPMLHWKGKRPFSSTQFYPAQLKETHGEEVNGWINKIFWGDNLQVMSHLLKEYRGKVKVIYIDPPFDSKTDYKKRISVRGKEISNDTNSFEEKQYTDLWLNDEYLQFLYERLIILRELLSNDGAILVHCDWHKSHYIRLILDEIFGADNFVNEILWKRKGGSAGSTNQFGVVTDTILFFKKSPAFELLPLFTRDSEEARKYIVERFTKIFEGRKYMVAPIERNQALGLRENLKFEYNNYIPQYGWMMSLEKLSQLDKLNRLEWNSNGKPVRRVFLDEYKGQPIENLWTDIFVINPMASERLNYPTQKPEDLLERIILASTNPNDIVFDCFMGSGTTQAVSMKLGRKFIGADINLGAIQTTTKRLINIAKDLNSKLQEETKYTGFQVYNVNHYDLFRNPLEAKELLIQALEIQPVPKNSLYDGEKDGKMVKIMPINRIATRADLNELITNLDYKKLEKLAESNPNRPVESILLVCMGHEPDLAAELQNAIPFKLDIEVVDILRDKANLEFKRDAEAEVVIEGGKILIREFYPMNLLQKLSLMKENVDNWKELTESIMIDFNYDDGVFTPQIVDVPEGNKLVKGVYPVPNNSGKIRVKITDLLSESIEITVNN